MAEGAKLVVATHSYEEHLVEALAWGVEKFGVAQARKYLLTISHYVERLGTDYAYHPECRFLTTKSRMYRNIILGAHLIIYRITTDSIEVLDIVHSAASIRKIRSTRSIRL